MDIIYEADITYRRALAVDRMWSESDVTGGLYSDVLSLASLRGSETVLDVAVGTGCLLQILAETLPSVHAIGVDRSAAMVRLAQIKLAKMKSGHAAAVHSEREDFIFKGASFDAAFCVLGLYHFSDALGALKEMKRVLKKGGRLVLCEYEAPADPRLRATLTESFQMAHPAYRFYTGPELSTLVSEAGLLQERSVSKRFTFDQHGVGGMPLGVQFFETRFRLERRGDQNLLASFDGNIFRPVGTLTRLKGALDFVMLRAVK